MATEEDEDKYVISDRGRNVLRLDKSTLIPLGSMITIVGFFVKLWISFVEIESAQNAAIEKLTRQMQSRWTCQQRERFFYELRLLNSGITFPQSAAANECGGVKNEE